MKQIASISGKQIRLTSERWGHIVEEHCELAGMRDEVLETVVRPDKIFVGKYGEFLAVKELSDGKFLITVYRESPTDNDGFVITAFLTRRMSYFNRREKIWPN
ncbi:MAG: hypothetical protein HQK63_17525 [Desulfamplus sp.]|nr:hypothetical protein [Desulfamplus sp.]